MHKLLMITILTVLLLRTGNTPVAPDPSLFDSMFSETPQKITIEANLDSLIDMKYQDVKFDGKFTWHQSKDKELEIRAVVSVRGKYRRRVCSFPPLEINFKEKDLEKLGFRKKYDAFKLVTHCNEGEDDNVFSELLAYQLYNAITLESFRVQPLEITYVNSGVSKGKTKAYGFFIEPTKEIVDRLDGDELEDYNLPDDICDPSSYCLNAYFQMMIGNLDWNVPAMRNIKLVKSEDTEKVSIIPYDFDYSGFVFAEYARPDPNYPVTSVRDRIFKNNHSRSLVCSDYLLSLQDNLIGITREFKFLHITKKNELIKYLNSFFELLKQPDGIQPNIVYPYSGR